MPSNNPQRYSIQSTTSTASTSSIRSIANSISSIASRLSFRSWRRKAPQKAPQKASQKVPLQLNTRDLPPPFEEGQGVPPIYSPLWNVEAELMDDDNFAWGGPTKASRRRAAQRAF